jgi:reactive intermediate/imine deaminase
MTTLNCINKIPNTPAALGPYSQAVECGNLIFLSGQLGLDPISGKLVDGGIEAQTRQALANIQTILGRLGLSFSAVAKSTIFVTDLGTFKTVNTIYEQCLGGHKPARSTVQVAALPASAVVEIEMIAIR